MKETIMKIFEYNQFDDTYAPYIQTDLNRSEQLRLLKEILAQTRLPLVTRWVIYQAFKKGNPFTLGL
jgi:hypothetical protein